MRQLFKRRSLKAAPFRRKSERGTLWFVWFLNGFCPLSEILLAAQRKLRIDFSPAKGAAELLNYVKQEATEVSLTLALAVVMIKWCFHMPGVEFNL